MNFGILAMVRKKVKNWEMGGKWYKMIQDGPMKCIKKQQKCTNISWIMK